MAMSSQCSGSSGGASAGGDCKPCSSNDLESFDSESDISSGRKVTSLLDWLRSPSPADIARLRKIKRRGNRKCRGALVSDPKGVSPSQRVKKFQAEPFTVSHGHLFCSACRKKLSLK